jgi:hypothetical protein
VIRPLQNRLLSRPLIGERSFLWTPAQVSRWGNGLLATRGEVMALGPLVDADAVRSGDVVNFSDSCGKPCEENGSKYLLIREDDIAFVEIEPLKTEWIGAMEVACDAE